MAIANISLGTVPSPSSPMSNARLWQLLGVNPDYNLGSGSATLVAQLNSALYDIKTGGTVLPRTITMVNGQPKAMTGGNLILTINDIPDATSNVYLRTNFSSNAVLNTRLTAVNAAIVSANLAMKTYVDARVTANLAASVVQTVTNSLNSGELLTPINSNVAVLRANISTLVSNAAIQGVLLATIDANIGAYQTYANAIFSTGTYGNASVATYLPTDPTWTGYLTLANANAVAQTTSINTLTTNVGAYRTYANAQAQSLSANLGAYQNYANTTLSSQATSINSVNNNITSVNARVTTLDANVGSLIVSTVNPLSADNITTKANLGTATINITGLQANVTAANARISSLSNTITRAQANISTLFSNASTQSVALTSIADNVAMQEFIINNIDANLGTIATTVNGLLLSNAGIQATTLASLIANAATQQTSINAIQANLGTSTTNIGSSTTEINALRSNITAANTVVTSYVTVNNANIGAYQTFANASLANVIANVNSLFGNAVIQNVQIAFLDAKLGAYQTYANLTNTNLSANLSSFYNYANVAFAGATYGNATVAAYLPTSPIWTGYIASATANAATQTASINAINANIGAYHTYANAQVQSINANIGAYHTYANATLASHQSSINTISGNLGAYETYANATLASHQASINTITANLGAFEIYANARLATGYTNADVFNYLNSYTGNLYANAVSVTNQISAKKITTTDGIFWANGTPYSVDGPAFLSYQSFGQNLTTIGSIGTLDLIFDSLERETPSGQYNTATGIFRPTKAGYYQVDAEAAIGTTSGSLNNVFYSLMLYKNTTAVGSGRLESPVYYGGIWVTSGSTVSRLVYLNGTTDYIRCKLVYYVGAGWTTNANLIPNYFQAVWLRA